MKIKSAIFIFTITLVSLGYAGVYGLSRSAAVGRPHKKYGPKADGFYKFNGKLNGKIPVFLWFKLKDSVLKGEVTYLKTAKRVPITIIGTLSKDGGLEFFEFVKGGLITGIYRGLYSNRQLTGSWYAPHSEKALKFALTSTDSVLTHIDTAWKPALVDGSYEYHYGKGGADGSIDLKKITGNTYFMEINCVTASPQNNVAEVERTKVQLVNNTIYYETGESENKCSYKISAFKDFIVIDRLSEFGGCFGMGAGPEGVFVKTSDKAAFAF